MNAQATHSKSPPPRNGPAKPEEFRSVPQDLEAEKAVLGSLILAPHLADDVLPILRPEDFYARANELIYRALIDMYNASRRIDPALLASALKKAKQLDEIGGIAYLADVTQSSPVAAHAVHYAGIVREKAILRALARAGSDIVRGVYEPDSEAEQQLNLAEERVLQIREQRTTESIIDGVAAVNESLSEIQKRIDGDTGPTGSSTGFVDLDSMLTSLRPCDLIVVAARPSMGKTALALNLAEAVSVDQGAGVLFVSLEMGRLDLADRLLSSRSGVSLARMRSGVISPDERKMLVATAAEIGAGKLVIDDSPRRSVSEIAASARRMRRKRGLSLVIVDYIQLIEPENQKDPREQQVARISRRLKGLAKELEVPVIVLAQLNRQNEARPDKRPRLSDLRESGSIEQDADVVMFVHRPEYYLTRQAAEEQRVVGVAEILVAKQRNGPTGIVRLTWRADCVRFANAANDPFEGGQPWTPDPF